MSRIVCFGEALVDLHATAPAMPGGAPSFVPFAGGAPANVAVQVARLGGRVDFAGMFGSDTFADLLLRELARAGVGIAHARRTAEANTGLAFVANDAHGERSFTFYRPPAADLLFRADDFDEALFDGLAVFHAGSCSLTDAAIARATCAGLHRARAAGALTSFDMNLRPALWPRGEDPSPRLWEALGLADLVKLSREEFAFLASHAGGEGGVFARLWEGATRWLVVTDGAMPLRWFARDAAATLPVFPARAIDTTGAGDAFMGGLLQGLAERGIAAAGLDDLVRDGPKRDELLRFACACGALAVQRTGSFAAMPARADVEALLAPC